MSLAKTEAMLFKGGSGTGSNLSRIRSSQGAPRGRRDRVRARSRSCAASTPSRASSSPGGKTRRAAKMVILNADHPDILEFIRCKADEEKKAWSLIDSGYDGGFNVAGRRLRFRLLPERQPLRARDRRLHALRARGLELADAQRHHPRGARHALRARRAARDGRGRPTSAAIPGIQYDTTINRWNPVKASGRIHSSNPCSEYMFLDDTACNLASLNLMRFVGAGRRLRGRGVPPLGRAHDPRAGDPGRPRGLPDAADRAQQPPVPPARARLREPGRAADGVRPAVRR